jgi:DnaJ-class molecular chaperone
MNNDIDKRHRCPDCYGTGTIGKFIDGAIQVSACARCGGLGYEPVPPKLDIK